MERLRPETISDDVVSTLRRFQGDRTVPTVVDVAHSNWATDPLFRGSYSYVAVGSSEGDIHELARPLPYRQDSSPVEAGSFGERLSLDAGDAGSSEQKRQGDMGRPGGSQIGEGIVGEKGNAPQVLFAGEATHPHYYSTTHGAWLSGAREAERIMKVQAEGSESSAAV